MAETGDEPFHLLHSVEALRAIEKMLLESPALLFPEFIPHVPLDHFLRPNMIMHAHNASDWQPPLVSEALRRRRRCSPIVEEMLLDGKRGSAAAWPAWRLPHLRGDAETQADESPPACRMADEEAHKGFRTGTFGI